MAFVNPPDSASMVYWYFMDGLPSPPGIKADLESLQKAGIRSSPREWRLEQ
jgi:hypothetical protein